MHGLQEELEDEVDFVRLDLRSVLGVEISREYNVQFAGTHVLLGRTGEELYRVHGMPDPARIKELVQLDLNHQH